MGMGEVGGGVWELIDAGASRPSLPSAGPSGGSEWGRGRANQGLTPLATILRPFQGR